MFTLLSVILISLLIIFRRTLTNFLSSFPLSYGKLFWSTMVIFFILAMVTQPAVVFEGATVGLNAWWNIVFPSLLPFFIAAELMMSFGIVHFMGTLLEPVMRPVFNVPGCGSFVMVVGYTSGCPIASMITAKLRRARLLTRVEAERLMCFTNNSSPLFMLVAVSVGMFNNANLGLIIAGAHYLANLTLGLMLKYYRKNHREAGGANNAKGRVFYRAFAELAKIHQSDRRPLGKILGDAVVNSINNLLKIGGFVILFAVIIRILTEMGFIGLMAKILGYCLSPLGFEQEIFKAIASGIFEMTLGTKLASEASAPLLQQLIAVAVILGWSGLSIHAQVASMIADTDIRIYPFIITRTAHAFIAGLYTYMLWKLQNKFSANWLTVPTLTTELGNIQSVWAASWYSFKLFILITCLVIIFGFFTQMLLQFKNSKV